MRFLSLLLCPLVILNPIWAQSNATASADPTLEPTLHVHVVDDPGQAQTQTTAAKGYVLQVTNSSGAPIAGAAVALRLPESGPTGLFENGLRAWVAYSDAAGIVHFPLIRWGDHTGPVELKVTVAKGTYHAGLVIPQQIAAGNPVAVSVVSVPVEAPPTMQIPLARAPTVSKPALPRPPELALDSSQAGALPSLALADAVPPDAPEVNVSHTGVSSASSQHTLKPDPPASSEPTVTITNSPTGAGSRESHKKLWVLLALGAGAGAAAMMALNGHGGAAGAAAPSSSGTSIGAPTISIGH